MWKECANEGWHFCRRRCCHYGMCELPQTLQRPQLFSPSFDIASSFIWTQNSIPKQTSKTLRTE